MIEVKNIHLKLDNKEILKNLSLSLDEQKVHVLIGTSGSGKTTLLKVIAGLLFINSGTVSCLNFHGDDLETRGYIDQMGYVIQEGGLFPHLSARENIFLAVYNQKNKGLELQDYYSYLLKMMDLSDELMGKFPHELSGGQRQRVGLIRALMKRPRLLLMDEPLGALDPLVRLDLQLELKKIFNTIKTTVVMVTHDINEAAFFGDTVTLLSEGEIVQHGSFSDFVHSPNTAFVTKFIEAQTSKFLIEELAKRK